MRRKPHLPATETGKNTVTDSLKFLFLSQSLVFVFFCGSSLPPHRNLGCSKGGKKKKLAH